MRNIRLRRKTVPRKQPIQRHRVPFLDFRKRQKADIVQIPSASPVVECHTGES